MKWKWNYFNHEHRIDSIHQKNICGWMCRKSVFKKLYLQMHFVGQHFHCYTPQYCKIFFQKYLRLSKKSVCTKKIVISNWKKECIEKNARKKCCMEKTTMSNCRKSKCKNTYLWLKCPFLGVAPIFSPFCLKSTNLKIYIYINYFFFSISITYF